ncbi:MAG: LytTR family transcriptional regulator [Lachnospiraceae bacterium]|nr:LytTR family transcriptional regulator [Lachnospiraceae bacterium]
MRIKLRLNRALQESVKNELIERGIEISEDAGLILTEEGYNSGKISCKDKDGIVIVEMSEIYYVESMGHDVFVHTKENTYKTDLRLYRIEQELPENKFLRISNSVIIKSDVIKKIRPGLSSKFYLTLKNGDNVDVTRTYYYKFKEFYGI